MKLSAIDNPELAKNAIVLLDGKQMFYCISADEEKGCVLAYVLDKDGYGVIEKGCFFS